MKVCKLAVLFLICLAVPAQVIRVTSGAVDDQVFQRGPGGRASIAIKGEVQGGGASLEARVLRKHMVIMDWAPIATPQGGSWSGEIKNLPTGGPYRIELRSGSGAAAAAINNILVGDLWVLAGQSNMQGVGDLINVEPPNELVHNFEMSDTWVLAEEPLHTLANATDSVHWNRNAQKQPERLDGDRLRKFIATRTKGAGLGLPFAVEMVARTGVPIGLLSCAHGGTSMDQWNPALKEKGGESLYGSMIRRLQMAGGKVTGVLWYQGESDSSPKAAPEFQQKFERFVAALRQDLKQPDVPFYYVQIGRFINNTNVAEWNLVQDAQRKAENNIPRSGMVPAIDTELDDVIHVGTQDLKRLGKRLANLACRDLFPGVRGAGGMAKGPRPFYVKYTAGVVTVGFSGVNGKLDSEGRISGFSIHGSDGAPVPVIYKAQVDPANPAAILLYISGKLPAGAVLRYGSGKDPYCNVRDAADMAVPVFGPIPIQQ